MPRFWLSVIGCLRSIIIYVSSHQQIIASRTQTSLYNVFSWQNNGVPCSFKITIYHWSVSLDFQWFSMQRWQIGSLQKALDYFVVGTFPIISRGSSWVSFFPHRRGAPWRSAHDRFRRLLLSPATLRRPPCRPVSDGQGNFSAKQLSGIHVQISRDLRDVMGLDYDHWSLKRRYWNLMIMGLI